MGLETSESKITVLPSPVSAPELVPFAKLGKQPVTGVDQGVPQNTRLIGISALDLLARRTPHHGWHETTMRAKP